MKPNGDDISLGLNSADMCIMCRLDVPYSWEVHKLELLKWECEEWDQSWTSDMYVGKCMVSIISQA